MSNKDIVYCYMNKWGMWVTNRSNMDMTDWNNSLKKNNCSLGNMDKIPCFDMGSFGYTPHNCKQENMDSQDNHN